MGRTKEVSARDQGYLREALRLARRGEGGTRPNPPVGAVVVRRSRVVGRGFHAQAGQPHAEVLALHQAGPRARGATLYVTLEPCSTTGRTGPCTACVWQAGIARVVIGAKDPNPRHAGRGVAWLRRKGIDVQIGVMQDEAEDLIAPFAKWITRGLPYVTVKLAASLDGRIADHRHRSRWISSPRSRQRVQELRARADALIVGIGTAIDDDPSLTRRRVGRMPLLRVIVDSRGRLPMAARVLQDGGSASTIIATTARCTIRKQQAYRRTGARVWVLPAVGGHVSLRALLRKLGRAGALHVVCEGGGSLAEGFIRTNEVDALWFFLAPILLGGGAVPAIAGRGWNLALAPALTVVEFERIGPDLLIRATPRRYQVRR
ncbi:MAG: bifunctional diaminohydroxyphosphoribosylaminopyrimidine deaminase/5-amino-6-(5-phosphoribosylamino)uracil reductase RibD [Verrucomicrobia bacterium]|nr:bifunctional diaminohydroxyphosphoribosylaminopyrimidine deaminase/5-amino-6-(5-phosphoribosylamino)uracil reductase RibD [Verrucomicrobiota bacterium]